jgi:hypothetical protein
MLLANASEKSVGYMDTVLFLTIGNAVDVQSPDIGKPDIYRRKDQESRQPILVIFGHPDKKGRRAPIVAGFSLLTRRVTSMYYMYHNFSLCPLVCCNTT